MFLYFECKLNTNFASFSRELFVFESGKKKSWLTIREWNPQEQPTLASKQENELIDIEKCYYVFNFIKVPNRQHIYFCAMGLIAKMGKNISLQALGL